MPDHPKRKPDSPSRQQSEIKTVHPPQKQNQTPLPTPSSGLVAKLVAWSTIIAVPLAVIGILVAVFQKETHDKAIAVISKPPDLPPKEKTNNQPSNTQPDKPAPQLQPKYGKVWVIKQVKIAPDPEERDTGDPEHKMRFKTGEEIYDAVYDIRQSQFPELNIGGPIIYTSCSFDQAHYHMTLCTPVNDQFHCHAHKERGGTGSFWYITVKYLSPKERCIANCGSGSPTPLPDEDDPNNYSFNVGQALNNEGRGCTWMAQKVR